MSPHDADDPGRHPDGSYGDGYYDVHPRIAIDRPLALVGHPGSDVDQVGRILCGRSGLVFSDVERAAESQAGCSRARVVLEQGVQALREIEAEALHRAVRRRPHGVIVLESSLMTLPARREWLLERACLVYVRRDPESLLARIRRRLRDTPGSLPEFLVGAPTDVEALRDFLRDRDQAMEEIPRVVEARDEHPARIAGEILDSLDRLLGVEPAPGS